MTESTNLKPLLPLNLCFLQGKNFDITTFVNLEIGVRNIEDLTLCKDGKQSTPPKDQPLDSVKIKVKMVDTNDPPVFETKSDKVQVHMVEESEPGQLLYTPVVKDIDSSSFRYCAYIIAFLLHIMSLWMQSNY